MKHFITTVVFLLFLLPAIAQSLFDSYIMEGNTAMKQGFFDMALGKYSKAGEVASTKEQISLSDAKVAEARRSIRAAEERKKKEAERAASSSKSRFLYSDEYYETGDIQNDCGGISSGSSDFQVTKYTFKVYSDRVIITSHADYEADYELDENGAGTVLPCKCETHDYRLYYNDSDDAFLFYKRDFANSYGKYRKSLHIIHGVKYYLYASNEVREFLAEESRPQQDDNCTSSASAQVSESDALVTFTGHWVLNIDSDGIRLGDTRNGPIKASEVCYLLFRVKYDYTGRYSDDIRFDLKIFDTSGDLVKLEGADTKRNFSTFETLEALPGGGIFNFTFGNDTPGAFVSGKYKLEIWSGNTKLYTVSLKLE